MDQMNENSERLQRLEAENKNLQTKLETMVTTATPPPGFDESVGSTKCESRRLSDRIISQHAFHT
ncbi:hypothetical protein ACOSQ3_013539 [Xanthoceras sorbifolium]